MFKDVSSYLFQVKFVLPLTVIFVIVLPRVLVHYLGAGNPWTSYLYFYIFGFIYYFSGMYLIRKTKANVPGRGRDSYWWWSMNLGFLFYASLHLIWIVLATTISFKGV